MTVPVIHAADSAGPEPDLYNPEQFKAWGVYVAGSAVHIWTRAEVAELGAKGIRGVFPIVVPPQSWPWIMPEEQVMTDLIREVEAWGVPKGSPLVLDIEEEWAERMGSQVQNVEGIFRGVADAAGFVPVVYGSFRTIEARPQGNLIGLLAEWPEPSGKVPADVPELAPGYFGQQYAGNVEGGRIDLDILALPVTLMSTDFTSKTGLVHFEAPTTEASLPNPMDHLTPEATAAAAVSVEPEHTAEPVDATHVVEPAITEEDEAKFLAKLGITQEQVDAALAEIEAENAAVTGDAEATEVPEKDEPESSSDNTATHEPVDAGVSDVVAIAAHPTIPTSYYLLTATGRVVSVRCPHYGDVAGQVADAVAIAVNSTGDGYWVACKSGAVYPYGSAGRVPTN